MMCNNGICGEKSMSATAIDEMSVRPGRGRARARQLEKAFAAADANGDGGVDKLELSALYEQAAAKSGRPVAVNADDTLKALDKDGDNSISKAEFNAGLEQLGGGWGSRRAERFARQANANPFVRAFKQADANRDGSIDRVELSALYEQATKAGATPALSVDDTLKALDGNSDGVISKREFRSVARELGTDPGTAPTAGTTTSPAAAHAEAEQLRRFESLFARIDANKDGGVDADEIRAELEWIAAWTGRRDGLNAEQLLAKLDGDGNGAISWSELRKALEGARQQPTLSVNVPTASTSNAEPTSPAVETTPVVVSEPVAQSTTSTPVQTSAPATSEPAKPEPASTEETGGTKAPTVSVSYSQQGNTQTITVKIELAPAAESEPAKPSDVATESVTVEPAETTVKVEAPAVEAPKAEPVSETAKPSCESVACEAPKHSEPPEPTVQTVSSTPSTPTASSTPSAREAMLSFLQASAVVSGRYHAASMAAQTSGTLSRLA